MDQDRIQALATELRAARKGRQIHAVRSRVDNEAAKAVAAAGRFTPLELSAMKLARMFSAPPNDRRSYWDSEIFSPEEVEGDSYTQSPTSE